MEHVASVARSDLHHVACSLVVPVERFADGFSNPRGDRGGDFFLIVRRILGLRATHETLERRVATHQPVPYALAHGGRKQGRLPSDLPLRSFASALTAPPLTWT